MSIPIGIYVVSNLRITIASEKKCPEINETSEMGVKYGGERIRSGS